MLHPEPWGVADARRHKSSRQPQELPIVTPATDSKARPPKSRARLWIGGWIEIAMSKATSPLRAAWVAYNRSLQVSQQPMVTVQHLLYRFQSSSSVQCNLARLTKISR